MGLPTLLEKRQQALKKRQELAQQFLRERPKPMKASASAPAVQTEALQLLQSQTTEPPLERYGQASVPVYDEDESAPSTPSPGLIGLVDLYLDAARNKTKHVALVWPAVPRSLAIVHVFATLERWAIGDKQGIRGLVFPAKTNAFHPLNHLYLDREALHTHAQRLIESPREENTFLTRKLQEKDSFLFSVASLKSTVGEAFNPTMSELIPHFFAGQGFKEWRSCSEHLLEHIGAKLKRAHKAALRSNCDILGAPKTAPDALFALDTRMSKEERRAALLALKKIGLPEVVLVNATRPVRLSTRGWGNLISHVCLEIDEAFGANGPGILIVTDDPNAAFQIRHKLTEQSTQRTKNPHGNSRKDFWITGICSGVKEDGLLPPGVAELAVPVPREFKLEIVDTEAARVINRLYRIAGRLPNGRDSGRPVYEAASYLSRLAALPCGISTLVEWLTQSAASDHARRIYSWATYHATLSEFERSDDAGAERSAIQECLALGTRLYENYHTATPLALRLAKLVEQHAQSGRHRIVIVFTSAIYRRLAERFLTQFDYPGGGRFEQFSDRVIFTSSSRLEEQRLEEQLTYLDGAQLIFVGLDEEGLRLTMTDNRVPKHTVVLMTQRSGQYLRSMLKPLDEKFAEFRVLKPRMESFLRQLSSLPDDQTMFLDDFVLPTFRTELSSEVSNADGSLDPEAWRVVLEGGITLYWKPTHTVFVYDPASRDATDRGFRTCEISSLQPGDKLFVMSSELRELVESVLKEAGVPIEHDKTFEAAVCDYHEDVIKSLNRLFQGMKLVDQVRQLRKLILEQNEKLAVDFPGEQSVRYWVNLENSADKLRTRAPMKEAHFAAFAKALGFNSLQAAYYWQRVIMPFRTARRLDGRHVSDVYSYMLLQPEAAMLHSKVSQQTLKILFQKARESIVVVENVIPPSGRSTDA